MISCSESRISPGEDLPVAAGFGRSGRIPGRFGRSFGGCCITGQVVDLHSRLGSVPIEGIEIDPLSRDDVPAILRGLQLIRCDEGTRQELFALLEAHFRPGVDRGVGRPGMDIWRIVVLAVPEQGLGCDFDRLQELANQHRTVREMLGHGDNAFDGFRLSLPDEYSPIVPK